MRSAAVLVNLCRLPREPHARLGLKLTPTQALFFDMSIMAASMKVDAHDDAEVLAMAKGDPFGVASLVGLIMRRGQRG